MDDVAVLSGLFAAAFFAATLIPAQSEAVLFGLLMTERYPSPLLLSIASIGNILGSCVNYGIGYFLAGSPKLERYISKKQRGRAEIWYQKYGRWSLLLSWAPFIGDPLTLVAGLLRDRFLYFLVIIGAAKTGRYLIVYTLHNFWTE